LVFVHKNAYSAMEQAHAIAVLTEWDEFKTYDWERVYRNMHKPAFIFDGRNILELKTISGFGFKIHSLGKAKSLTS
jgi:UDPglucose 6-dehydrogenase